MLPAAIAAVHRRRQRPARVEDEEIVFPQVIVDLVETRVLDVSSRAIDHKQPHLIAQNPAAFRRFLRAQLRRQNKFEWRAHPILSS
jgi:hypothetical protein